MIRNAQSEKNENELEEKIDFLCEITEALLDEVKYLSSSKNIKFETEIDFDEEVKKYEIYLIERALEKTGGRQTRAARMLNLKHTTLNSKIKRYDICLKDSNKNPG